MNLFVVVGIMSFCSASYVIVDAQLQMNNNNNNDIIRHEQQEQSQSKTQSRYELLKIDQLM